MSQLTQDESAEAAARRRAAARERMRRLRQKESAEAADKRRAAERERMRRRRQKESAEAADNRRAAQRERMRRRRQKESAEAVPFSNHEQRLSRTFDEVMKLGEFSDTAGSGCSSGSNDQVAGRGEDSEGSGREERNDRAGEALPRTSPPSTSPPDTLSVAGQGGGGLDDELDGLPVFGVDEEEEDWHFALPMDTLAELDIDRPNNRPDELTDRQKDVRDNLQTDGQADEDRVLSQGESRGSAYPTHTSSPDSLDGAVLNHSEGGLSPYHQKKRSESEAPADRENPGPPIPPLVNIKDEPIDEGYDSALLPQSSSLKQIKEELEHQEDELRISSVYSVGGGNSYVSPTVPAPAPQTPSIEGAGRSLAPVPAPPPAVQPAPPPQAQPPPSGGANPSSVRCSGCSKVLLKGQTAYQRKGSTQLFCSTVCLTGFLPNTVLGKTCHQCLKEIENPKNLISVPMGTGGAQKDLCSQFCLSVFNCRKKNDFPERPSCSVCKRTNRVQHEVTYQGTLHRLCSDHCFSTWRHYRQLAMNCCENCGMYCNSKGGSSQVLTIGDVAMKFCSPTCIGTYKQTCSSMMDCAHCKNKAVMSSMLVSNDLQGKVKLYCSSACVSYSRPPQHVLTVEKFKRRWAGLREPTFEYGPTIGNMPQSPAPDYTAQSQGSEVVLDLVPVDDATMGEDQKLLGTSSPSTAPPPTSSAITTTVVKQGPERKSVDQPVNGDQSTAFEEKLLGILREQNNQDELWCLSLAPKLKQLSDEQKSLFQMRVAQLLHEVRFS